MMDTEMLIRKGYFPEEIIPPLNTEELADKLDVVLLGIYGCRQRTSRCIVFSIPKLKEFRLNLAIPNPLHQILLSKTIEDKWSELTNYLSGSNLSITPIVPSYLSRRSIEALDFVDKRHQEIIRSTSSRYSLHLDISKFYSSIYTHSIPWALHTKSTAKAYRSPNALLGNVLDKAVRDTQDGQTMGIPIGPDTSRIISELIGVAIDKELQQKLPALNGLRYIDDFYLYFNTLGDLEKAKAVVQTTINHFGLELNPNKYEVEELPFIKTSPWVTQIRTFEFSEDEKVQRTQVMEYFSLVFHLASVFSTDYVIPYGVSRLQNVRISKNNYELYESLLLKSLMTEPKTIRNVLVLLLIHKRSGKSLNMARIKNTLTEFLKYHTYLEHTYEVAWGLWFCKSLGINIDLDVAQGVVTVANSTVALVALDMVDSNLFPNGADFSLWKSQMNAAALYSEDWLLAYEAYYKKWLTGHSNYVENDDFFSVLYNRLVRV